MRDENVKRIQAAKKQIRLVLEDKEKLNPKSEVMLRFILDAVKHVDFF